MLFTKVALFAVLAHATPFAELVARQEGKGAAPKQGGGSGGAAPAAGTIVNDYTTGGCKPVIFFWSRGTGEPRNLVRLVYLSGKLLLEANWSTRECSAAESSVN